MSEDLKAQLRAMIVERLFLNVEPETVKDDENLMAQFGIDSVALFEIIVGLEDEFGITLDENDFSIATFETVDSIAAFVESKRA